MNATALIAEDEPMLAANLQAELALAWPGLRIVANVRHGAAALEHALALQPDLLFLDIRMPGMSGLEAAQALAEEWPGHGKPFPLLVFVSAYDQYAVQAFDSAAIDYVLKPVLPERLKQTCARLQAALAQRTLAVTPGLDSVVGQLRALLGGGGGGGAAGVGASPAALLRVLQVGTGNTITMVPVDEVIYFEAADKYMRVITLEREHLIRTSLRELQAQLDPQRFWQVHRGTIVHCDAIAGAQRDESGKLTLLLRGHPDRLAVSRLYSHRFKGM
jgi:DNA-binding LytR/AlgR family response regulator